MRTRQPESTPVGQKARLTVRPRLLTLCVLAALVFALFSAGPAGAAEGPTEVLVGSERDFKPYSFIDKKGRPAGFGVDLIRAVADAMDIPIRIESVTWDAAWNGLKDGRFDALPIVAKLPSRTPHVDFSLPHTETFDSFFVRSGEHPFKDIGEAEGKEIIVMRSDAAHHALLEHGFEGKIIPVETVSEMLSLLASGKHDALLFPKLLGIIKIKELGIKGIEAGHTIPDYHREFSFAVQKGDIELLEKLNQGLLIVKSNGVYEEIYEKWFGFEDPLRKYAKYFWPVTVVVAAILLIAVFSVVMLQRMVKKRTIELAEKNRMLSRAREELSERVEERTAELLEANAALEIENAERRQAEEALRASEAFKDRVLTSALNGLYIYDLRDGCNKFINPEYTVLTGYTLDDINAMSGREFYSLFHPEDRAGVAAHRDAVAAAGDGEVLELEYRFMTADGRWIWCFSRDSVFARDGDGSVRQIIGTFLDITERKRAEEELVRYRQRLEHMVEARTGELKEANLQLQYEIAERTRMESELMKVQKLESLGVFAGGIAHDFNNLLQTISNCISVAKMHASEESPAMDVLKDAETASRYASNLSHRLLTFAKGGEPIRKVTSISGVLEESVSLSMSGSDIVCETVIPDGLHPVEVDEGQMNQVFSNLLINARDAMPGGGTIRVSASNMSIGENERPFLKEGEYIRISVEDQGTGIREENLDKIFDPYFSTKDRGAEKGTGLGLSVCHSVIKKHDGLITVESREGVGTTFHVFLPASKKPLVKEVARKPETAANGGRILLMEDEKNMWLSTRLIFNALRYEVEFAVDGAEAVSLYEKAMEEGRPFGGVILDLTIPGGMGGKETIDRIRDIDKDVKAIVVSGYTDDPVMTNFREYGFVCALAKPYTVDQLKSAVRDVFS